MIWLIHAANLFILPNLPGGHHCMPYATRDFSGGECARALRYALGDLQKYLESPAVRENHNQMLRREFEHLLCNEELYRKAVMPVDLRWLKQKMNSFETLLQHCQELYDNHTHGVVYAVKFAEKYSETLEYHREMGIKSFCPVSLETIVAKVKLPLDYQCTPFQDNKRINAILDKKGLYAMF